MKPIVLLDLLFSHCDFHVGLQMLTLMQWEAAVRYNNSERVLGMWEIACNDFNLL